MVVFIYAIVGGMLFVHLNHGLAEEIIQDRQQEVRCDMKLWYLDMLTSGALTGTLGDKQALIKNQVEEILAKHKGNNIWVVCRRLSTYEDILKRNHDDRNITKDDVISQNKKENAVPRETPGGEKNAENDNSDGISEDDKVTGNKMPRPRGPMEKIAKKDNDLDAMYASSVESGTASSPANVAKTRTGDADRAREIPSKQNNDVVAGVLSIGPADEEYDETEVDDSDDLPNLEEIRPVQLPSSITEVKLRSSTIQDLLHSTKSPAVERRALDMFDAIIRRISLKYQNEQLPYKVKTMKNNRTEKPRRITRHASDRSEGDHIGEHLYTTILMRVCGLHKVASCSLPEHRHGHINASDVKKNDSSKDTRIKAEQVDEMALPFVPTPQDLPLEILLNTNNTRSSTINNSSPAEKKDKFVHLEHKSSSKETTSSREQSDNKLTDNRIQFALPVGSLDKEELITEEEVAQGFVHGDSGSNKPDLLTARQWSDETKLLNSKIERLFDARQKEYQHKIETLEMQILRMENRILVHTLTKQNNTASFARLENQFLTLQNELLHMNQDFVALRTENAQLKQNQNNQANEMAIFKRQEIASAHYSTLEERNAALTVVISAQQKKIIELSESMKAQSKHIQEIEDKTEQFHQKNKVLLDLITKESSLIEQIEDRLEKISREQEEQNIRNNAQMRPEVNIEGLSSAQLPLHKPLDKIEADSLDVFGELSYLNTLLDLQDGEDVTKTIREVTSTKEAVDDPEAEPEAEHIAANKTSNSAEQDRQLHHISLEEQPRQPDTLQENVKSGNIDNRVGQKQDANDTKETTENKQMRGVEDAKRTKQMKGTKDLKQTKEQEDGNQRKQATNVEDKEQTKLTQHREQTKESKLRIEASDTKKRKQSQRTNNARQPVNVPKHSDKDTRPTAESASMPHRPKNNQRKHTSGSRDCYDLLLTGRKRDTSATIHPLGSIKPVEVFCDMKNGGWTVIQRRNEGAVDFFRTWNEYRYGFGTVRGDHWLGNEAIHLLTNQDDYSLRIEMMDWDRNKVYAQYDTFFIDAEEEGYRLHVTGYSGDAGDALSKHNNHKFSTKDVDNDLATKDFGGSCSIRFGGAWWYYKCYKSNLNGRYYRGGAVPDKLFDGIAWKPWTGSKYSLKKVEMKIRPLNL